MPIKYSDISTATKVAYIDGGPTTILLRKCKLSLENGEEYVFDTAVTNIGAVEDNDLVIAEETVSRYHSRIIQEDNAYILIDLKSTNGTFINGVRIREAYLTPGCTVHLGTFKVTFQPVDEKVEVVPSEKERFGDIIGKNLKMREMFGILEKIAPTSATIIIEGETGTGKEVVAKTIHEKSPRRDKQFIVFDCGAVPENLIESELFGHEKGSFTGAIMTRQGLFELAQGGTIFLDELGELSLELQPKLLRVLEQREIRRVGSNRAIKIDARVIAATNRNLETEVAAGRFREDLFYRLSVVRLFIPPLREKKEDIPLLIKHFLTTHNYNRHPVTGEMKIKSISQDALTCLINYAWPGNIRELVNVIERSCSLVDGDVITLRDLPHHIVEAREERIVKPANLPDLPLDMTFKDAKEKWIGLFEKDFLVNLLKKNSLNISHAAREADIDRKYFRKLMKKYGIEARDMDEDEEI